MTHHFYNHKNNLCAGGVLDLASHLARRSARADHLLAFFPAGKNMLRRSIPDREQSSLLAPFGSCIRFAHLCRRSESNTRRQPLQGCALPLSYSGNVPADNSNILDDFQLSYWKWYVWDILLCTYPR